MSLEIGGGVQSLDPNNPFKYVPPRIDEDKFQAAVPPLQQLTKAISSSKFDENGYLIRGYKAFDTDEKKSSVCDEFLRWCQKFLSFSTQFETDRDALRIVENEDTILEFLHRYNYDLQRASFILSIRFCCGKDFYFTQNQFNFLEKSPSGGAFTDFKDRFARMKSNPFFGTYSISPDVRKLLNSQSDHPADLRIQTVSNDAVPLKIESILESEDKDYDEDAQNRRVSSRVLTNEKTESRKRWIALLGKIGGTRNKMSLIEAQLCLDEAMSIPIPFNVALCSGGSAAQTSNDLSAIDNARSNLSDFIKKLVTSRLWIAEVRDQFYRTSVNGFIVDSSERSDLTSFSTFEKLLQQGKKLDYEPTDETALLESLLGDASELIQKTKSLLSNLDYSPLIEIYGAGAERSNPFVSVSSNLKTYPIMDLENRIRVAFGKGFERLPMADVISLNTSFEFFYETLDNQLVQSSSAPADDITSVDQLDLKATNGSISLEELEAILLGSTVNPLKVNEFKYLSEIYRVASLLNEKTQLLADFSSVYKLKSKLDPLRKKLSWRKVCSYLQALSNYPIILPAYRELLSIVQHVLAWRQEVNGFNTTKNENADANSASTKRSQRRAGGTNKDGGKEKKPVPIKRVDALLAEGERFPFNFPEEMNILRDRKDQTKLWLEKLKKSISAPKRSNYNAESVDSSNKLTLEEMRLMINDGKQLYQQMDDVEGETKGVKAMSKDLSKATNVVEAAEDWILRFQETITAHVDHEISIFNNAKFWQSGTPVQMEITDLNDDTAKPMPIPSVDLEGEASNLSAVDEEEKLLQSRKDLIKMLQDLLVEADSMPIALEEAEGIRCQVQALEWANRNRSVLIAMTQPGPGGESSRGTRLRFSEISQLKNEITKIRNTHASKGISGEFQSLVEEKICMEVSELAEQFLQRLKKLQQGKDFRNGTSLETLRNLLNDSLRIPINFDYELRPVKVAVSGINDWLTKHASLLKRLNVLNDKIDETSSLLISDDPEKMITDEPTADEENNENDSDDIPTEVELDHLIDTTEDFSVDFPTLTALHEKGRIFRTFKAKLTLIKSRFAPFLQSLQARNYPSDLFSSLSLELLGRKGKKDAKDNDDSSAEISMNKKWSAQMIDDLIAEGNVLGISLDNELTILAKMKQVFQEWEERIANDLETIFSEDLSQANKDLEKDFREPTTKTVHKFSFLEGLCSLEKSSSSSKEDHFDTAAELISTFSRECEMLPIESRLLPLLRVLAVLMNVVKESKNLLTVTEGTLWGDLSPQVIIHSFTQVCQMWRSIQPTPPAQQNTSTENDEEKEMEVDESPSYPPLHSLLEPESILRKCWKTESSIEFPTPDIDADTLRSFFTAAPVVSAETDKAVVGAGASSGKKKRSRANYEDDASKNIAEEDAQQTKSTRLSSGIVKKRVDENYADTSKLHIVRGTLAGENSNTPPNVSSVAPTSTKRKGKGKDKSSEATAEETSVLQGGNEPASSTITLVIPPNLFESLPSLEELLNTTLSSWIQVLWCCIVRLRECFAWKKSLEHALSSISTTSTGKTGRQSNDKTDGGDEEGTIKSESTSTGANEVLALLDEAKKRGIKNADRDRAETLLISSIEWMERARKILTRHSASYLSIDETKDFIRKGESILINNATEMTALKSELRKARQWKSAFDEVSQSEDQMQNKTQEINELITESKTLCVDVTEFIDSVLQATRMYCLCRQVYFGHMIGCDTCDEWYHFQCVGLTQAQAEKADKYVCIRCMLKSSIQSTAAYCAKITNKWMDCTEHFRAAEMNIQKTHKRFTKDSMELERYKKAFQAQFVSLVSGKPSASSDLMLPPPAPSAEKMEEEENPVTAASEEMEEEAAKEAEGEEKMDTEVSSDQPEAVAAGGDGNNVSAISVPTTLEGILQPNLVPVDHPHRVQIETFQQKIQQIVTITQKSRQQLDQLVEMKNQELQKINEIIEFMIRVQKFIWPENDEDLILLGSPLGPTFLTIEQQQPATSSSSSEQQQQAAEGGQGADVMTVTVHQSKSFEYGLSMRVVAENYDVLLPLGLQQIRSDAQRQGILGISDVQHILESFRWINWCSLTLHLLRFPPPSPLFKKAIDSVKTIQVFDDKITRLLTTISTKISGWKSKARKLFVNPKKLDEAKVTSFVLDGNNLPVTTRIKRILKDNHQRMTGGKPSTAPSTANASSTEVTGKRQKATTTSSGGVAFSGDFEAFPNSTDDEAKLLTQTGKSPEVVEAMLLDYENHQNQPDPKLWYLRYSYPMDIESLLAANPEGLWPPKLDVKKKPLVKWK